MTVYFNTYRFGMDEAAVGRLIDGDIPEDDVERGKMLRAPRYRIQKLLDEHERAQAALRECKDTGRPFILYLRSFAGEARTNRDEGYVVSHINLGALDVQKWIEETTGGSFPVIRLHGGADGLLGPTDERANILSTHEANWEEVAEELIEAASAIVFVVSHVTPGVAKEFDRIQGLGRLGNCLFLAADPQQSATKSGSIDDIRRQLAGFPHIADVPDASSASQLGDKLRSIFRTDASVASMEATLSAPFSYLDPSYIRSDDWRTAQDSMWNTMRQLRAMFDASYWKALEAAGLPTRAFSFPGAWKAAHRVYGIALATSDFRAIEEALSYLRILYDRRSEDLGLEIARLAREFAELATRIFPDGLDKNEAWLEYPDPLTLERTTKTAIDVIKGAQDLSRSGDMDFANYLAQVSAILMLNATDGEETERRWILGHIFEDWATLQSTHTREWSILNYRFARSVFRSLPEDAENRNHMSLANCASNLGSQHMSMHNHDAAEAAMNEAIEVLRTLPGDEALRTLSRTLSNVAQTRLSAGDFTGAEAPASEALRISEGRLQLEPAAIGDVTRVRALLSISLSKDPSRRAAAADLAWLAAEHLDEAAANWPASEASTRDLVNTALRSVGVGE